MSTIALRGPERVVIRQHRWTLWTVGVLTLAGIAAVVAAYLWMASASDTFAGSGCSAENTVRGCGDTVRHFLDTELLFSRAVDYANLVMMILPAFIGMFVAGPLIGRELESGTYKLSWSQSVSPARWLAAKLAVPGVLALAGVFVLSAVSAWARSRTAGTHYPTGDWYERQVYGSMGTVPVGYALCMLAIGALAGLLLRRTVTAMVVTVAGYGALVAAFNSVRNNLWPTLTDTFKQGSDYRFPDGAINAGTGWLTQSGRRLPHSACLEWSPGFKQCLTEKNIDLRYFDYHPASHFWPLQLVETGILLVLAALAVAVAFRVLRRRHG
ncbi:ABC transporter permease subunit [Streptomyces sp. NBC_01618]|uniref:ABC transporter permease subunit n=1 Tax=Streptomyces sp. NBC_01618 TaxID=2975900 RepID=UPI003870602C|nr:ABC transporter permease [Streptomyces sp. NBC_01618]